MFMWIRQIVSGLSVRFFPQLIYPTSFIFDIKENFYSDVVHGNFYEER